MPSTQTCAPGGEAITPSPWPLEPFRQALRNILDEVNGDDDHYDNERIVLRIRFWLPAEMEELWQDAFEAVRILLGGHASTADAVGFFLDSFLAQYGDEALDFIRQHPILERDGCRCVVPTCGRRANLHVHHLVYRSAGGGNEPRNTVTLCSAHHLQGIHEGWLRVTGYAPDALLWQLGLDPLGRAYQVVDGRTVVRDAALTDTPQQSELEKLLASPLRKLAPEPEGWAM